MEDSQKRYFSYIITIVAIVAIVVIAALVIPTAQKATTGQAALTTPVIDDTPIDTIPSTSPPAGLMSPLMLLSPSGGASTAALAASTDPPGTTDFYGTITLDGQPAPEGTLVTGITANGSGFACGNFTVSAQSPGLGWFGFLHCSCGGSSPSCSGETISFTVNGQLAIMTGNRVWDESIKRVDLVSITRCVDGVSFNHCEQTVPKYCKQTAPNTGTVINNCAVCGCPPGRKIGGRYYENVCCPGDGTCSSSYNPSACAVRADVN
jgi:hypothetical protein